MKNINIKETSGKPTVGSTPSGRLPCVGMARRSRMEARRVWIRLGGMGVSGKWEGSGSYGE